MKWELETKIRESFYSERKHPVSFISKAGSLTLTIA